MQYFCWSVHSTALHCTGINKKNSNWLEQRFVGLSGLVLLYKQDFLAVLVVLYSLILFLVGRQIWKSIITIIGKLILKIILNYVWSKLASCVCNFSYIMHCVHYAFGALCTLCIVHIMHCVHYASCTLCIVYIMHCVNWNLQPKLAKNQSPEKAFWTGL